MTLNTGKSSPLTSLGKKLEEILEVVEEVKDGFKRRSTRPMRSLRIEAVKVVAARRGIGPRTVADKFLYGPGPQISSIQELDEYLEDWLVNRSTGLQSLLLNQDLSPLDARLVAQAFSVIP
jgi:hypothetical protein